MTGRLLTTREVADFLGLSTPSRSGQEPMLKLTKPTCSGSTTRSSEGEGLSACCLGMQRGVKSGAHERAAGLPHLPAVCA